MAPYPKLVNTTAVRDLIMNETDAITRRFMIAVKYYLGAHMNQQKEPQPSAAFDVLFFMTIVRDFFHHHNFIRDLLEGKEVHSWEADTEKPMVESPKLLNTTAARELIMDEPNATTRRLMIAMDAYLRSHIHDQKEPQPRSDVDELFFMTIVRDFLEVHEFIRDLLDGKEINSFEPDDDEERRDSC